MFELPLPAPFSLAVLTSNLDSVNQEVNFVLLPDHTKLRRILTAYGWIS